MLERLKALFGIAPSPVPVKVVPRPVCPFYGFYGAMGTFMDQHGNQCPLVVDSYAPCRMQMRGDTPNWIECCASSVDPVGYLKQFDGWTVAPAEFWPEGVASWKGLSFKDWCRYVLGPTCPRPSKEAA